ncbi:hypothetical protein HY061_00080 [Candidatus Azambacteria bacterium]|nr:hypothetical protein [Candidatus Azambacteria bacterium]
MKYTIFNFIESVKYTFFLLIVLAVIFLPIFVSAGTGTIQGSTKFAWSNNVGYINFAPVVGGTYYGLTITDGMVNGYAWSANSGWIKFNDFTNPNVGSEAGVKNNGGVLSGYAWGANLGWINFTGVTINTGTGKFSGIASGNLIGTLKFDDCPTSANCNVVTDWRPTVVVSSSGGGGGGAILLPPEPTPVVIKLPEPITSPEPVIIPSPVEPVVKEPIPEKIISQVEEIPSMKAAISEALPISLENVKPAGQVEYLTLKPNEAGTYSRITNLGEILIDIPANSISTSAIVTPDLEPIGSNNDSLVPPNLRVNNNFFYNVTVKDNVTGKLIHSFSEPLKITLPVPEELNGKDNLAVFWLDEAKSEWVIVLGAVFSDGKVIFEVNHLTRFAIFTIPSKQNLPAILVTKAKSIELAKKKSYLIILSIILVIIFIASLSLILWKRKQNQLNRF